LSAFEKVYGADRHLTVDLRKACRGRDQTYLPILVRLACGLDSTATTIADVYERTVNSLLRNNEGLAVWVAE